MRGARNLLGILRAKRESVRMIPVLVNIISPLRVGVQFRVPFFIHNLIHFLFNYLYISDIFLS